MHTGLLNVFENTGDENILAITQHINIELGRVAQIAVNQNRTVAGYNHGLAHIALQLCVIIDDFHSAAAQNIGRANNHRKPDVGGNGARLVGRAGNAVGWLTQIEAFQQILKAVAIFSEINGVGVRAQNGNARLLKRLAQFQRGLAAKLHNDTGQFPGLHFALQKFQHVFLRQRLEIQPVGSVVIGRDGLGITIDHNAFDLGVFQGKSGVAAAIIKLNALADAVWATAKDNRLFATARDRLILPAKY